MLVELTIVNTETAVVPIFTTVAPKRLVPVIVTVSPYGVDVVPKVVDTNDVMVGTSAVHLAYMITLAVFE